MVVTLPRSIVPLTTGRDVSQINVVLLVLGAVFNLLFQSSNLIVQTKLENISELMVRKLVGMYLILTGLSIFSKTVCGYLIEIKMETLD